MLNDKFTILANILKGEKFIIAMIGPEPEELTYTLVSDELNAMERVWLARCIQQGVDRLNDEANT